MIPSKCELARAPLLNYNKAQILICQGVWREVEDKDTQLQASLCLCRAAAWFRSLVETIAEDCFHRHTVFVFCQQTLSQPALTGRVFGTFRTVANSMARVDINTHFPNGPDQLSRLLL